MASNLSTTFGNVVVSSITAAAITATGLTLSGDLALGGNDISGVGAYSGATSDITGTQTGATIIVDPGSGTGYTVITGDANGTGTGGTLCIEDNDGAGFSTLSCLNGTCTARAAGTAECPTG